MPRTWQQNTQKYLPWLETVTVTSVRPNSTDQEGEFEAGAYKLTGVEGAPSYGVYTKYTVRFTLSYADLPFDPKPRDRITWKDDTYTVLSATGSDWQQFWVADAVNLVLAEDLRQTGTLTRWVSAQDAAYRPARAAETTVAADVPCRVQPLGWDAADVNEKRTGPRRFAAFLGQALDARAGDRFAAGGESFTVVSYRDPERVDELPSLTLEAVLP